MATPAEQEAFVWMQGRMVELLMRHDVVRLSATFGERRSALFDDTQHTLLHPYRELAVLFYLRDELFGSILPRIKRRLSFLAPREIVEEQLPPRGRVDWPRTMAASLRDRPGEPPLEVHTRQRRRHFATPENLLTVTTLLEYRSIVQRRLDDEADRGAHAMRHPLREIVESCERELAFPQFTGLVRLCERIADGYGEQTSADLEQIVGEHLIPGRNSAYDDLITWRQQLTELRLLDRDPDNSVGTMLGSNPAHDNYLYQLWIFYELADLLSERGCMKASDVSLRPMRLRFRWEHCVYELRHDQAVPLPIGSWQVAPDQAHRVPGVRPDFYLWRVDPASHEVRAEKLLIWREPGVVWDAKYYRERDTADAPAPPIKRMVADLTLIGETHGTLLFAFLKGQSSLEPGYHLQPAAPRDQTLLPTQVISIQQLRPGLPGITSSVRDHLVALIAGAHEQLGSPRIPACYGVFLDALSAQDSGALTDRWGATLESTAGDLLLCPKPHIGPWRVDLVSRSRHCCSDARLCHIVGQPTARIPLRPPRSAEELIQELAQLVEHGELENLTDAAVSAAAERIEQITRRFAEISGYDLSIYENRLRDLGLDRSLPLLQASERESLALAVFLVDKLDGIKAKDYSGPAIHVSSVMEIEVKRRIFACPGLVSEIAAPRNQTLGKLPYMRWKSVQFDGDWDRIKAYVADHWDEAIFPDDDQAIVSFDTLITELDQIKDVRNHAAHTTVVSRDEYRRLFAITCQAGRTRIGALNALLLAWKN